MYISHQGLQAIHQDVVNDALKRSERRRLLKGVEERTDTPARTRKTDVRLMALVRLVAGVMAR
jgi:hypothetical protein